MQHSELSLQRYSSPSLVLFDVGATLVDPHPSARELVRQVLSRHGFGVESAALAAAEPAAFKRVAHLTPFHRYGQEESSAFWDLFYAALLTELSLPDERPIRAALYAEFQRIENWRLYPDVVPALDGLRRRGVKIGVVSNWEEWLEDLLLSLDIHAHFDFILASGPFGRAKPHASIFERALELAGVTAPAAVHVGDSLREDIEGALAVGLRPILIDRHERYPRAEVTRIVSLDELAEAIGLA
jgi:putative hydrolase of the HAD superfamily